MKDTMEDFFKVTGIVVIVLLTVLGTAALGAYPTKWIMNYLFSPALLQLIFGVTKFNLLRAFCLNFVASTLIKGTTSVKS